MEICLGKVLSLSKLQIWARKNGRHPEINGEKKRQEMTFKTCDEKASSQIWDQTFQHDNAPCATDTSFLSLSFRTVFSGVAGMARVRQTSLGYGSGTNTSGKKQTSGRCWRLSLIVPSYDGQNPAKQLGWLKHGP